MAPLDDAEPPGQDTRRDAFQMLDAPAEPRSFAPAIDDAHPPETDYDSEARVNEGLRASFGADIPHAADPGAE